MYLDKTECLNIVNSSTEEEFSVILFGLDNEISLEKKKKEFIGKIKGYFTYEKLTLKDNDSYFGYVSEFISSLSIIKKHNSESILYKNINSRGYDGAFIKYIQGMPRIFLSETKSSNEKYDSSKENILSKKIEEASNDLQKKFNKSSEGEGSNEREKDNADIVMFSGIYISKKIAELSDLQKENIIIDYRNIRNSIKLDNSFLNAVARYDNADSSINSLKLQYDNLIPSLISINTKSEFIELGNAILKKMGVFYG